jgi:hypothetical protein
VPSDRLFGAELPLSTARSDGALISRASAAAVKFRSAALILAASSEDSFAMEGSRNEASGIGCAGKSGDHRQVAVVRLKEKHSKRTECRMPRT